MKRSALHLLLCVLLAVVTLTAVADNTLRGRRLRLSPKALSGTTTKAAAADTLLSPPNDSITLAGYAKPLQSAYEREFGIREALTADSQRDIDYQAIRPGRLVFNRFCLFPDYELPV